MLSNILATGGWNAIASCWKGYKTERADPIFLTLGAATMYGKKHVLGWCIGRARK